MIGRGSGAKAAPEPPEAGGGERLIALAGNPNVGKSTLFNRLTGLRQHTGNWAGKTVGCASGRFALEGGRALLVDTPGAYSLAARSDEEARARDFLCCGGAEAALVVCDAACPERGLILALQILELTGRVVVCMNLTDEARRRGVSTDTDALALRLGVPVVSMAAARGEGISAMLRALETLPEAVEAQPLPLPEAVEEAARPLADCLAARETALPPRWIALRLLEGEAGFARMLRERLGLDPQTDAPLAAALEQSREALRRAGLSPRDLGDLCAAAAAEKAEALCAGAVRRAAAEKPRRLEDLLAHPVWGGAAMLALLALCLWLTVSGANAPSEWLSRALSALGALLGRGLDALGAPPFLRGALLDGVYTTLSWVVAVMLPPMAIFFPLFSLLEDAGLLPRVAFHLDGAFEKSGACGKQALTMCMGLGCNAAGVVGCRIIDSPREKLLAVVTNGFMPCNGRFPAMIAVTGLFAAGALTTLLGALGLTALIALGAAATLLSNRLLTRTLLRGENSSFTLELPPFRAPQLGKTLLRSLLDRTLFVLSRAVTVAAPAGLVLWLLANLAPTGEPLLALLARGLDGAGRLLGLDGAILLAFLLGLPANEIVLPIALMVYLSQGTLTPPGDTAALRALLVGCGWTARTAVCFALFSLLHWPCSTTLLTVKRETGSWRYTLLAAALPTVFGAAACMAVNAAWRLIAGG